MENLTNLIDTKLHVEKMCSKRIKQSTQPLTSQSSTQPLAKYDINMQMKEYKSEQFRALTNFQWTSKNTYTQKQLVVRESAFKWVLTKCQDAFQLRHKTLELTMKLFDVYENKISADCAGRDSKNVLPEKTLLILDLLTILYMTAKYEEIYPPALSQFVMMVNEDFVNSDIIQNQMKILFTLQTLNYTTVSDFYKHINDKNMPYWAYYCYVGYDLSASSRQIAADISTFITQLKKSGDGELKGCIEGLIQNESMCQIFQQMFKSFRQKQKVQSIQAPLRTKKGFWRI